MLRNDFSLCRTIIGVLNLILKIKSKILKIDAFLTLETVHKKSLKKLAKVDQKLR